MTRDKDLANIEQPIGSIIEFSFGEYSDRYCVAVVVVLSPFNIRVEAEKFLEGKDLKEIRYSPDLFIAHLLRQGLVISLTVSTVSLGGYHVFDDSGDIFILGEKS